MTRIPSPPLHRGSEKKPMQQVLVKRSCDVADHVHVFRRPREKQFSLTIAAEAADKAKSLRRKSRTVAKVSGSRLSKNRKKFVGIHFSSGQ